MNQERLVRLVKEGPNQALPIPLGFEMPGNEVVVRKKRDRLIIEPVARPSLLAWLRSRKPLDVDFPDVDEGLLPLDDVEL